MTLYRGDGALNRKRRTYGLAWTADRDVAQARAEDVWRTAKGGSVLLETHAPASAIICAAHLQDDDRYGEIEYLLDRRRLVVVTVLRRFSQISHAELRMRTARRLKEQRPLPSDTRTHSHERA